MEIRKEIDVVSRERENRRGKVDQETQYQEFVATCRSRGMPRPTVEEWERFSVAKEKVRPHVGYAVRMLDFARSVANDLGIPLRITAFASPTLDGLGLLRVTLARREGVTEINVSGYSVLAKEPLEILSRNRNRLRATPPPVVFQDEECVCFAGAEGDWVPKNVPKVTAAMARHFIQKIGMRN
jgi:hypothetical protein